MSSTVSFSKPAPQNDVDARFDSSRCQKGELCQHISNLLTKILQASASLRISCTPSAKKAFDLERSPFRSTAEASCVFDFLDDRSILALACAARYFPPLVNNWYKIQCSKKGIFPESLPNGVNYKQLLCDRFPNAIGRDTYREYLGDIDMVPFPRSFIEMAPRPGFQIVFIPEYITLELPENSSLMLDETTADNNGNMALLVEDPEKALKEARTLKVPVTLNNVILLFQKYLKKKPPSKFKFAGLTDLSWDALLAQNGNKGVGPSHWSYQKKEVIGFGSRYLSQVEIARAEGLEIAPLCERILFHLLSHIKTGQPPKQEQCERTSTVTFNNQGTAWPSTLLWPKVSGSLFRLDLYASRDSEGSIVGAAAEVGAESSQV